MMATFTTALLTLLALGSVIIPAGLVLLTLWDVVWVVVARMHDHPSTRHD